MERTLPIPNLPLAVQDLEPLADLALALADQAGYDTLSAEQQELLVRARVYGTLSPAARRSPRRPVHVLRHWDRHHDDVDLWADKNLALDSLAAHVRDSWSNVVGQDGVPDQPPADNREAVALYYGPRCERGDEDYTLYEATVGTRPISAPAADDGFPDAEACEKANRAAVFHAMTGEDELPCQEVEGVLTFTYLDADARGVRISVDLDTAADHLVLPDGTVALRVDVGDDTLLDTTRPRAQADA